MNYSNYNKEELSEINILEDLHNQDEIIDLFDYLVKNMKNPTPEETEFYHNNIQKNSETVYMFTEEELKEFYYWGVTARTSFNHLWTQEQDELFTKIKCQLTNSWDYILNKPKED